MRLKTHQPTLMQDVITGKLWMQKGINILYIRNFPNVIVCVSISVLCMSNVNNTLKDGRL